MPANPVLTVLKLAKKHYQDASKAINDVYAADEFRDLCKVIRAIESGEITITQKGQSNERSKTN